MAGSPPPQLVKAIAAAAKKFGVSPQVLTGIWRIESGSSFPNNFKNSLGYGGLFGTTKWNAPVQEQADYAASILASLIRTRGSLSAALLAYSGNGYSSVDGSGGATTYNGNATNPAPAPAAVTAQTPVVVPPQNVPPPTAQGAPQSDVEMPGSQNYTIGQPHFASNLWTQVNQGQFVSPEALLLGQNAAISTGG